MPMPTAETQNDARHSAGCIASAFSWDCEQHNLSPMSQSACNTNWAPKPMLFGSFRGSWDHAVAPTMLYIGRPSYFLHFRESPPSATTRWPRGNSLREHTLCSKIFAMKSGLCCSNVFDTLLFTWMTTKSDFWLWSCIWLEQKKSAKTKDFTTSAGRLVACVETSQRLCFCHGMNWRNGLEMLQVTEEKFACGFWDGTHKYVRQAKPSAICKSTIGSAQKNLGKALTEPVSLTLSFAWPQGGRVRSQCCLFETVTVLSFRSFFALFKGEVVASIY